MRSPTVGCLVILLSAGCNQVGMPTSPTLARSSASSLESGAATVSTTASSRAPFKGTLEGIADPPQFEPPPSMAFSAHLLATGNATQLGRFKMDYSHRVEGLDGVGTATFTAANGDAFTTSVMGKATPTGSPTAFTVVETHTVTGVNGRFVGATGSVVVTR